MLSHSMITISLILIFITFIKTEETIENENKLTQLKVKDDRRIIEPKISSRMLRGLSVESKNSQINFYEILKSFFKINVNSMKLTDIQKSKVIDTFDNSLVPILDTQEVQRNFILKKSHKIQIINNDKFTYEPTYE